MSFDPRSIEDSLLYLPLLPAVSALLLRLFGRRLDRGNVSALACGSVFASFVLSLLILWPMVRNTVAILAYDYGVWFKSGGLSIHLSFFVDHLNATLAAVVTGVGFLIHLYSTEYMREDPEYHRYFAYLNLFVAFMLVLVLANNIVLMFVGWEGVGLCSYLLIGFWYEDEQKATAGRKAFVVNRIGDFGFLLGIFTLIAAFGTTEINPVQATLAPGLLEVAHRFAPATPITSGVLATLGFTYGEATTLACLLLFVGAVGKSAQVPLYVWLPDAMAGPTPVSALIHAATMVTAGVYLVARLSGLYSLSPTAMLVVTSVGAFTALFAALMGFAQNDIKKVLAYSTVSQLGFMVLGVGIGAWWQAIFLLVAHAFFKALLFLGSGSVIQGCHHEQDIRHMGGLRKRMPTTAFTFLIGTLAITGVVPLSGFFAKDLLLHFAHHAQIPGYPEYIPHLVYLVGTAAALCTAFYMFRLYFLTFEGEPRSEQASRAHESGPAVKISLWALALGSVAALAWGLPALSLPDGQQVVFDNFTMRVFGTRPALYPSWLDFFQEHAVGFAVALAVAWAGMLLAYWLYRRQGMTLVGRVLHPGNWLYELVANKFYVDEIYAALLVRPFGWLASGLYHVVDAGLIDGVAVRGTAWAADASGRVLRSFQNGDVQRYAAIIAIAAVTMIYFLTF